MTNYAHENSSRWMDSILEYVAALKCDYDRLEDMHDRLKGARIVGWNTPGYMPDSEPFIVADADDGRAAIAQEMRERADLIEYAADMKDEDDNGRDDSADVRPDIAEMRKLREVADWLDMATNTAEEFGETIGNTHFWMTQAETLPDDEFWRD